MRKIVTIAYKFDELDNTAKEKAIEDYRNDNPNLSNSDWHKDIQEDIKAVALTLGIEIDHIYFSGFWSQGDGACFVGRYEYQGSGSTPKDETLSEIKNELDRIQKQYTDEHL